MAYSYTMYIQFHIESVIVKCVVHKILDARLSGSTTHTRLGAEYIGSNRTRSPVVDWRQFAVKKSVSNAF